MQKPKAYNLIFGLSADPIHKGHEQAIINAIQTLSSHGNCVDHFCLVPVYQPNLIANKKAPVASFAHRINMCELVANRLSKKLNCPISVSQIEKQIAQATGQANYSLNTIKQLHLPNSLFVVSADHFSGRWPKFKKWHKWQEILQNSGLLINQRPGHKINQTFIKQLQRLNENVFISTDKNQINTSSTTIRHGIDGENYLSEDVSAYITQHSLYWRSKSQ
jgi:nicotinate (nicotinamide) nucleotide adenylyltransferase